MSKFSALCSPALRIHTLVPLSFPLTVENPYPNNAIPQMFSTAMCMNPLASTNSKMLARSWFRRKKPRIRMGVTAKTYILSSPMTQDDVAVMESVCDSSVPQRAVTSVWSATRTSSASRAAATRFRRRGHRRFGGW